MKLFSEGTTKRRLTNIEKRSKETASAPRETTTQEMPSSDWRSSTVQPATCVRSRLPGVTWLRMYTSTSATPTSGRAVSTTQSGAYREVLLLDPDDLDAKVNLELALLAQVSEASSERPPARMARVPESGLGGEETESGETEKPASSKVKESRALLTRKLNSAWTMPWAMPERAIY